jgi:hypothetical protein|tara:strand:- start:241 stop:504 length:264 start_codon:yes stop_codon:yes gene_type:complete
MMENILTTVKSPEQFLTKSKFAKIVEQTVLDLRIPYLEAILEVCEDKGIEPEDVSKFISPVIKGKLEVEAQKLKMVNPSSSESITLE